MNVALRVNGRSYEGWKEISISHGLERLAGSFDLTVSDKWPGQDQRKPIRPGMSCTLSIDDQLLITGYIDDVLPGYGPDGHDIKIKGRDLCGDLVDCSAIYKSGEWHNKTLKDIASNVCEPFGINVINGVGFLEPFTRAAIEEGESCFELLERLARQRGVLLNSNAAGDLIIIRPGSNRINTQLIEGANIKAASGRFSHRDRYSEYIGKGQHPGDDGWSGEQAAAPIATLKDKAIRHRPLIIHAEDNATPQSLRDRIAWERTVRQARSTQATITVQGWKANDVLWRPNRIVKVISPSLELNHDVLISAVEFNLAEESGTTATLTVTGKNAYTPQPEVEQKADDTEWAL